MQITGVDDGGRLVYECVVCSYQETSEPVDLQEMGLVSKSHSAEEILLAIAYGEPIWRLETGNNGSDILIGARDELEAGIPAGGRLVEVILA